MDGAALPSARAGVFTLAVAWARHKPGQALAVLLACHLVVWTLLPIYLCPNLQLDLAEDLALGREWQLGYWKHPPLPWWIASALYQFTGQIESVYVLGPLAVVICFLGVWLLAREVLGAFEGLIAVLILEGVHFYNFSAVKFAHDQVQLPFWAFTGLFAYRAFKHGRTLDWLLAGALLAGCFWSKYAAFALAATLGLFLLFDPMARRAWRTPGPYLMALAFAVVIGPNAWWVVTHDFMPFQYVDERARMAAHWYQYLSYPLQWIGSQAFFLLPAIGLLVLLYRGSRAMPRRSNPAAGFDRRYVTALALGPFLVTTLVAAVLGRLPVAMWGYPLWSFLPLAVLMWLPLAFDLRSLRGFAAGAVAVFLAVPVIYAAVEVGEPFLRDRPKATQFPGEVLAEVVTRDWHDTFGTPLTYVGGAEFATNNVAVYSPDRPHVIVHGEPKLSPWIDMNDLRRRGALLIWEEGLPQSTIDAWHALYGPFEIQPALVLARQTWHPVKPTRILYAFVPPRP